MLNEHWPDLLLETEAILYMNGTGHYKEACRAFLDNKVLIQLEQILVYFISTYFCGAVYDGEVLAKAQMSAVCTGTDLRPVARTLLEKGNCHFRRRKNRLLYRYSREIEHSDENLKIIEKIMVGHKVPWLQ